MPESPLVTLTRLLAGVVLMQGRLGHQVLGQMLVAGSSDVAIAGASVIVAATSRQKNAVAQVALRTAAPVLAVRALLRKQEERIERKQVLLARREQQLDARDAEIGQRECEVESRRSAVDAEEAIKIAELERQRSELIAELERLSKERRARVDRRQARKPRKKP